ncbi:MAG: hypothetical protein Q9222_007733 [Ikaeria aurantiellina]
MSRSSSSTFFRTATGQETAFPSATYLRKRYSKLHKRKVSRIPITKTEVDRDMASLSPAVALDPSFLAIRALNGHAGIEKDPVVLHALVEDAEMETAQSTPIRTVNRYECLASSEHDAGSFSARIDSLMHAINQGWKIRFEQNEQNDNVEMFACDRAAAASDLASPRGDTAQLAAHPENIGGVLSPIEDYRASSSLDMDDSDGTSLSSRIIRHSALPEPLDLGPMATTESTSANCTRGSPAWEPIISEGQRLSLQQRILKKIAENEHADNPTPTALGRQEASHPPIPGQAEKESLQSRKTPETARGDSDEALGTSSHDSGSDHLSPLKEFIRRKAFRTSRQLRSGQSKAFHPLALNSAWSPSTSPSHGESPGDSSRVSERAEENPAEEIDRSQRVTSWIRRVKDAVRPGQQSPAKPSGKAFSIYQDASPRSSECEVADRRPLRDMVLSDVTNLRQSGYLKKNSFAQQREAARQVASPFTPRKQRGPLKKVPFKAKTPPSRRSRLHEYLMFGAPGAVSQENKTPTPTRTDRGTSTEEDELDPDVVFSLARLEGRMPPSEVSPFPIRRYRDGNGTYGPDVEVELNRLKLNGPHPARLVRDGAWISPLQRAVEAGFDCALEAPEDE